MIPTDTHRTSDIISRLEHEHSATEGELVLLLKGADDRALFEAADRVRKASVGDGILLRGIIDISNICMHKCLYCGISATVHSIRRYRMPADEILRAAEGIKRAGCGTAVIQAGETPVLTTEFVADLVERIRSDIGLAVTLSLGERPESDYRTWRQAGANRYLLKLETSDPLLYAAMHPGMAWTNRIVCHRNLLRLGFQVGSGVIIGLPGQSVRTLARDLLLLKRLGIHMSGNGPFVPAQGSALESHPSGSAELTLRFVALLRLLAPHVHIAATTALSTVDPQGRQKAMAAGANVIMPDFTPIKYREAYSIYRKFHTVDDTPERIRQFLEQFSDEIGRPLDSSAGHYRGPSLLPGSQSDGGSV